MKIIGYRRSDFVTKEGRPVTGCRILKLLRGV